jgi:hypothetical protein
MSKPSYDREALTTRFRTNMARIGAIAKLLHSDVESLKQTGLFRSEGVRADILRAVVVFLHAAVEDFIRAHLPRPNKTFSLSSASDIKRELPRFSRSCLVHGLFPPLTHMAKRRNQIVHHADLQNKQSEEVNPWGLADKWLLIQWLLAASAFHHRIRKATGHTNMVEDRARENLDNALVCTWARAR